MVKLSGDIGQLSNNLKEDLRKFGDFIEAEEIVFMDLGNRETMNIYRKGKVFSLAACGSKVDGGFFGYSEGVDV